MFAKMLVPVDGSAASNAAVDLALKLARENNAWVLFIHAVEISKIAAMSSPAALDPFPVIDAACKAGQAILADAQRKAVQAGVSSVAELLEDQCIRSVVQAAGQHKADLVILGSHGRRGIPRALLGSVVEGILRRSPIPVLVCHAPASPASHSVSDLKEHIEHEGVVARTTIM